MPLRRRIHRDFGATLTGEPEALLKGLILGERSDLPHQTLAAFADAGTVHILAVSGFNVGLVVLIYFLFFRSMGLSPTLANLLLVPLLIVYAGLTDFTPSVVRATIMAVIFIIGFLLERESSLYNLLGLAALVILLLWPQVLFDLSFILSFAATFGVVFLAPRFYGLFPEQVRKSRWGLWLLLSLFVTLSAQMFSTPLILQSFYRLSLVSPLANLIILPLVTLATALGFSRVLSGFLTLSLSRIFAAANCVVLKGILASASFFAHLPYASLRFGLPVVSLLGLYGLLLSTPWIRKRWEARVSVAFAALLFLVPLVWRAARPHSNTLMVTFLDVGQGDAALLEFPNGRGVLLDGGGAYEGWNAGEWDVAPFLWIEAGPAWTLSSLPIRTKITSGGCPLSWVTFRLDGLSNPKRLAPHQPGPLCTGPSKHAMFHGICWVRETRSSSTLRLTFRPSRHPEKWLLLCPGPRNPTPTYPLLF